MLRVERALKRRCLMDRERRRNHRRRFPYDRNRCDLAKPLVISDDRNTLELERPRNDATDVCEEIVRRCVALTRA